MTDREAFVRQICADPADDTVRLVYADWLEEHGEPDRAELIRVQIALARWEHRPTAGAAGESEYDTLTRREVELLALARESLPATPQRPPVWRRGFIDELDAGPHGTDLPAVLELLPRHPVRTVRFPLATFMENSAAVFRARPLVDVILSDREPAGHRRAAPDGPEGYSGWWTGEAIDESPEDLPDQLWRRLAGYAVHPETARWWRWYPTAGEAQLALARACVVHGRELAGLPGAEG